jgi:hypothetical protein
LSFVASLRAFHLAWLSQPSGDRAVYRAIRKRRATKIVEFGVGDLRRATRMIRMAAIASPSAAIHYAGIDEFELRRSGAKLPLKAAWQRLRQTGAKVRLAPGDPFSALARCANDLAGADIVVISLDVSRDSLAKAAMYLPRIAGPGALILAEALDHKGKKRLLKPVKLADLAPQSSAVRRAA